MSAGMKSIVSGVVLIGIGLAMGGSIFSGDASLIDWGFDILGLVLIGRGVLTLASTKAES